MYVYYILVINGPLWHWGQQLFQLLLLRKVPIRNQISLKFGMQLALPLGRGLSPYLPLLHADPIVPLFLQTPQCRQQNISVHRTAWCQRSMPWSYPRRRTPSHPGRGLCCLQTLYSSCRPPGKTSMLPPGRPPTSAPAGEQRRQDRLSSILTCIAINPHQGTDTKADQGTSCLKYPILQSVIYLSEGSESTWSKPMLQCS